MLRSAMALVLLAAANASGEVAEVKLKNATFEEGQNQHGVPDGWRQYGGWGKGQRLCVVDTEFGAGRALLIQDGDPSKEIGVEQNVAIKGGLGYEVVLRVCTVKGATTAGSYVQLRFFPSNTYVQRGLSTRATDRFEEISLKGVAPEGATLARLYLYTHAAPTPTVMIESVKLLSGVEPPPQPPPAPPKPIPPVYSQLKELHLTTPLVSDGKPAVAIIVPASGLYGESAEAIQEAIRGKTGASVPVVTDDRPAAELPLPGHAVVLGNRSTNRTIAALYDKFYTLVDLKYPGPGGSVLRTVHSALGDGRNVVLVGGSDEAGVARAASALIGKVRASASQKGGSLALGWLMEIQLDRDVPGEVRDMKIWEESRTYGSSGYFGWNVISKHMAMYYMTGDERHAREFLRLAFPDDAAIKELEKLDGERIENKHEPLAGPYHYSAHMMIQFWDLIEESPLFTDEQRLRVTNAFSKQLTHRAREHVYGRTTPPASVGNRHGDWAAMSLYSLARYFQKDYPDPIWECALKSVKTYFSALERSAWLAGNNDHLFWYTSYYDPMLDYMIMSGDRAGVKSGNLEKALRTQDILFTGNDSDWGLRASSLNFLQRAAHLTGDGRFLFYRQRTDIDTDVFRLGQSYWADDGLKARPPTELLGKWTVQEMPEPMWKARRSGLPLKDSFLWGSYRSTLDGSGDYVLIKGHNGGGRNPYHTFVILELRLNGVTLLKGYHNQVLTSADGMVEPRVAMDGALRHCDVVGQTAFCVGEVPSAAFCNWRRTLAQRTGRYALIVDDLTFRTDSDNMKVVTEWGPVGALWRPKENVLRLKGAGDTKLPAGWLDFRSLSSKCTCGPGTPEDLLSRLGSIDIMLLKADGPGTWIEMAFHLEEDVAGEVFVELLNYKDRGIFRFLLDGQPAGDEFDHYAPSVASARASLGRHKLAAGEHRLRVQVVGKNPASPRHYLGLRGLSVRPDGAPAAATSGSFELHPSELTEVRNHRNMEWAGQAKSGAHRIAFYLLAQRPAAKSAPLGCFQLSDNAAALALPEPGVAVAGEYRGIDAELAILAESHLFGRAVRSAGLAAPILTASAPVDVDWDFQSETIHVVAAQGCELGLSVEAPGKQRVTLAPGRHTIEGAGLPEQVRATLSSQLSEQRQAGLQARERLKAAPAQPELAVAELKTVWTGKAGGNPVGSAVVPSAQGDLLCLASNRTVHVLGSNGKELRRMETDGPIRVIRWWPEHKLLLVGCKDEKVIAFDERGKRKWVFVSEMDRAVWEAAKQYWFKSAHPGIYGLHTDVFIDGKSQCFVGSACTLEIIDGNGQLVKRMPVFWGPGWRFTVVDGPGESRDLLIARQPTDSHALTVVNSKSLRITGRRCDGVPAGHTYVTGWSTMSTGHIVWEDLDGDGKKELTTAVNGIWNRVTVCAETGRPLYNAQCGPGKRIPTRNIRDLAVADLDGDGKQEIVVATHTGLVVALTHRCEKFWSKRLSSPPNVLKCLTPEGEPSPWTVVGCDSGAVLALNGQGETIGQAKLNARAATIDLLRTPQGLVVVLASDKGEVEAFAIAP